MISAQASPLDGLGWNLREIERAELGLGVPKSHATGKIKSSQKMWYAADLNTRPSMESTVEAHPTHAFNGMIPALV